MKVCSILRQRGQDGSAAVPPSVLADCKIDAMLLASAQAIRDLSWVPVYFWDKKAEMLTEKNYKADVELNVPRVCKLEEKTGRDPSALSVL